MMVMDSPRVSIRDGRAACQVFGIPVQVLMTGEDTGGAFSTYELTVDPGQGPPPHRHSREDECFYVVEGTFEFLCGDTVTVAESGTQVLLPRGLPHAFRNTGSVTGRLLGIATPAGHETFFADVDALGERAFTDPEAALAVCRDHGIELLLPG